MKTTNELSQNVNANAEIGRASIFYLPNQKVIQLKFQLVILPPYDITKSLTENHEQTYPMLSCLQEKSCNYKVHLGDIEDDVPFDYEVIYEFKL